MRRKNFKIYVNNQMLTFLITLYVIGFIFGLFVKGNPIDISLNQNPQSFKTFLDVFCMHYWYFFVIWLMGLCSIGFIINILINFFRGFIFAVLISSLIKISFKIFIILFLVEVIIFLPVFMYLLYLSSFLSLGNFFNSFTKKRVIIPINLKTYQNSMLFITCMVVIYSIILMVI